MAEPGVPIYGSLYVYAPNKVAPVVFAVAFGVSTIFHTWQCFRYKAWKMIGLHPACAALFTIGYACREYGAFNYLYDATDKTSLFVFIVSQIFILVGPPLLELANYHVLGRILHYMPYMSPFPPGRVTALFGGLMMLVEALNGAGAALVSNTTGKELTQQIGRGMVIAALALQLLVVATFAYLAGAFHRRCAAAGTWPRAVHVPMGTLYASMALILVRSLYRLLEYTTGNTGVHIHEYADLLALSPLLRYEAFFYVFEASLMLVNSVLWNVWNPGRFLPADAHRYLTPEGLEVDGEKDAGDQRPLLLRTANVMMFGLLIRNDDKGPRPQSQELRGYP